jgi:hypothetical protein
MKMSELRRKVVEWLWETVFEMLGQENETGYLIMSTINWWRKAVF